MGQVRHNCAVVVVGDPTGDEPEHRGVVGQRRDADPILVEGFDERLAHACFAPLNRPDRRNAGNETEGRSKVARVLGGITRTVVGETLDRLCDASHCRTAFDNGQHYIAEVRAGDLNSGHSTLVREWDCNALSKGVRSDCTSPQWMKRTSLLANVSQHSFEFLSCIAKVLADSMSAAIAKSASHVPLNPLCSATSAATRIRSSKLSFNISQSSF